MKRKVLIPTVLCGVLLATSAMAFPWGDKGGRDGDGQRGDRGPQMRQEMTAEQHTERAEAQLKRMSTLLELSDKQQTQLKEIFDQQWQGRQELREAMQTSRDAMLAYRLDEKFDESKLRSLAEKEADVKIDMMVEREKNHNDVLSVLTEEQQAKLDKLATMERGPRGKGGKGGKDGRGDRDGKGGKDGRGDRGGKGGKDNRGDRDGRGDMDGKGGRFLLNQDANSAS